MSKESKTVHVVPAGAGWTVRKGGASRALKRFDSQQKAVSWGRRVSKDEAGELVVHGRDGTIRSKDTYRNDPRPPKDRKK